VRLIAEISLFLLLMSLCAAQVAGGTGAELRKLKIARSGDKTKMEFTLSKPVVPEVTVLINPHRLVLDLPNTAANPGQRHIAVKMNGVVGVRVGLKSSNPLITRTVVDLSTAHRYTVASVGNTIVLMVLPEGEASATVTRGRGAAPAANGLLIGKLLSGQSDAAGQKSTTLRFSRLPVATDGGDAKPKASTQPSGENLRVSFKVKYVAEGAAYLKGGRTSGLVAGMKLVVHDPVSGTGDSTSAQGPVVAELQIVSVAETSAVTEIRNAKRDVKPGDWADLSTADLSAEDSAGLGHEPNVSVAANNATPALTPAKATTQPNQETLPEESRIRARLGFDYSGISSSGSTAGSSSSFGMALQTDMMRIAGTHWNLQGYWRGRLTSNSQPNEDTLQDYLDRTYTIQLYYDNPDSKWVAGFGRLYLPWAVSLDTIDGGYVGRKIAKKIIAGVFLGSTPDPASWHYSPDQQIAGSFVNLEGGSYDDFHYTSTVGMALSMLKWQLDRPYLFLENGLSYTKYISVYHSLIVDSPQGISTDGIKPGTGISRSYLSLRVQPKRWISFDVSHNYFRDVPTAATALIGTGLVDKLLYQGVNVGVRVEPVKNLAVYTTLGRSDKTGDVKQSLNQMYGITWSEIWRTGLRADIHYSKFDSSFAQGNYQVLSLSRHIGNRMNWDAQVGRQALDSTFTVNHHSLFVDTSFDTNLGSHTYLQSGYTIERGEQLNYNQWYLSLGYRLNVKGPVK
jgi:AMIN domain